MPSLTKEGKPGRHAQRHHKRFKQTRSWQNITFILSIRACAFVAGSISNCDAILQSKQFFISIEEEVVRENYKNEKLKYKFTEDFLNQLKPQADSKRS